MKPTTAQFLDRNRYRMRRARDAAFVLPVLGAVLMIAPMLWGGGRTSTGGLYLFAVWVALIVLAFVISRLLRKMPGENMSGANDKLDPS